MHDWPRARSSPMVQRSSLLHACSEMLWCFLCDGLRRQRVFGRLDLTRGSRRRVPGARKQTRHWALTKVAYSLDWKPIPKPSWTSWMCVEPRKHG